MGMLIDGEWHADPGDADKTDDGRYKRQVTRFRNWITPDGAAGPSGESGCAAESGRYHLYVAWACPWAHRTLIFRTLKGLEPHIGLSIVDPMMLDEGWVFSDRQGTIPDTENGARRLYEVYQKADSGYTGRVSVPVLWDRKRQTIVSNESAEIIRMLNGAFDGVTGNRDDYYPPQFRDEIDAVNATVYETVNNGVYRAGFATSQQAYEEAFVALFATLDELEERLGRQRYVAGNRITEADWRLFTTLLRFDPVYFGHFKCNKKRIADYPNLYGYLRELYQWPGIKDTVNLAQTKLHYYASHRSVNPTGIVPLGPEIDLSAPHDRDRFSQDGRCGAA